MRKLIIGSGLALATIGGAGTVEAKNATTAAGAVAVTESKDAVAEANLESLARCCKDRGIQLDMKQADYKEQTERPGSAVMNQADMKHADMKHADMKQAHIKLNDVRAGAQNTSPKKQANDYLK